MKKETKIISVFVLLLVLIISVAVFLLANKKDGNTNNFQGNEQQIEELNNSENQQNQNSSEKEQSINQRVLDAVGKANTGNKEQALNDYLAILNEDPANLIVLNNIADLYSDMSNWTKSEEYYKKLIEVHPEYIPGYRMLAYLYWYRFNDDEVKIKSLIDNGLEKNNNHPDLLSWIINYYQEKGEGEKALPYSNLLVNQLNGESSN